MNHTIPFIVALLVALPAQSEETPPPAEAPPAPAEAPPEQPAAAPAQDISGQFDCIELELFTVNKDDVTDSAEARAAEIPPEMLEELRNYIVIEIPREMPGMQTRQAPEQKCNDDGRGLVFGGQVTDYKKGNKAARYFIGFGAGKQKFEVDAVLKRKSDGSIIAQDRVVDRKAGGVFGGSTDKGKQDFAEKVADFIHEGLTGKKAD